VFGGLGQPGLTLTRVGSHVLGSLQLVGHSI
jgi:hypothetical protein